MLGWILLGIVLLIGSWMALLAPKDPMDKPAWATWSSIKAILTLSLIGLIAGFLLLSSDNKLIKYGLPVAVVILTAVVYFITREKEISRISTNVVQAGGNQASREIRKTAVMMHKMKQKR